MDRKWKLLWIGIPSVFAGLVLSIPFFWPAYAFRNPEHVPSVIMEVMDESLDPYAAGWQAEIARRFPDAVGILCHGGEVIEGEWIVKNQAFGRLGMKVDDLVAHYQAKYPGRTIVLLACNPGHLHCHGAYHAMDSVWCVPDRETMKSDKPTERLTLDRWRANPTVAGNIFEFTED